MIQRGIVEQILDKYLVQVRIPVYDKAKSAASSTKTSDLAKSIICVSPGTEVNYVLGDVVLVGFENDEISKPVILGLLYRSSKTGSSMSIDAISDTVALLEEKLGLLENNKIYCHLKYSNDNGKTFTSLYDYKDIKEVVDGNTLYSTPNYKEGDIPGIEVDPLSKVITWSILNGDGVDVTQNYKIDTTLFNEDGGEVIIPWTDNSYIIEKPPTLAGSRELYIDFKIYAPTSELEKCHISLSTDINTPGSIYGDALGMCITTDPTPPTYPAAYTWSTFLDTIQTLINNFNDSLEPRVRKNELDLRNDTNSGLTDAIKITSKSINIYREDNINQFSEQITPEGITFSHNANILGNFNKRAFVAPTIDTNKVNYNNFVISERSNNHLTIKIK